MFQLDDIIMYVIDTLLLVLFISFISSEMAKQRCSFYRAYDFSATGLGIQLMPAIAIVKDWFDKRRPLAMSINSAASPISIFTGLPLAQVTVLMI